MISQISERTIIRAEAKAKAIDLLGGECANCGSTELLQFDHIKRDREDDYHCISAFIDAKWERVLIELAKCQLLCRPCHNRKSAYERGRGNPAHGTVSRYRFGCRCEQCRSVHLSYMKHYRYRKKREGKS